MFRSLDCSSSPQSLADAGRSDWSSCRCRSAAARRPAAVAGSSSTCRSARSAWSTPARTRASPGRRQPPCRCPSPTSAACRRTPRPSRCRSPSPNTDQSGYVTVWPERRGDAAVVERQLRGRPDRVERSDRQARRQRHVDDLLVGRRPTSSSTSPVRSSRPPSAKAGRFVAIDPVRLLDSRAGAPMAAGGLIRVALPATAPRDAVAAAVTLTTSGENEPGFFTAFGAGSVPWSSSLNVDTPDSTRAATVVVPVSGGGLSVFSSGGGHLIVDFLGYFTGASAASSEDGLFVPMTPKRLLDTRSAGRPRRRRVAAGARHRRRRRRQHHDDRGGPTRLSGGLRRRHPAAGRRPASTPCAPARPCRTWPSRAPSSAGMAIYSQQGAHYVFDQTGYFTGAPVAQTVPLPCPGRCSALPGARRCGAWLRSPSHVRRRLGDARRRPRLRHGPGRVRGSRQQRARHPALLQDRRAGRSRPRNEIAMSSARASSAACCSTTGSRAPT